MIGVPQSIVTREAEFYRKYRDESGAVRQELVKGIDFGLDFPQFALFQDAGKHKHRTYLIIHRPSGKSVGETTDPALAVGFLAEVQPLLISWSTITTLRRRSPLFEEVQAIAKRHSVSNL